MWWLLAMLASSPAPAQALPDAPSEEVVRNVLAHEDELLVLVERESPEQHRRLLVMRDTHKGEYIMALLRVAKMVQRAKEDPSFAERARAIRDREVRLRELARGFDELDKPGQRARRAELETVAGELMDLKQEERKLRLDELRARLVEFEGDIEARERDRNSIIDTYVDQLISEPVEL